MQVDRTRNKEAEEVRWEAKFSNARCSAHRTADGRHYSARFVPTSKYSLFVCFCRTVPDSSPLVYFSGHCHVGLARSTSVWIPGISTLPRRPVGAGERMPVVSDERISDCVFCRPDQGRHPEDTVFAHVKKKSQPLSDVAPSNEDNTINSYWKIHIIFFLMYISRF